MEDVLAVYQRVYDARTKLLCMDEGSKQLVHRLREDLPMEPGKPRREDYEYEPEGFCSLFLVCDPIEGRRFVQVRERRTKRDWAEFMREVIEKHFADADKIVLVMDNLNTHLTASFYEVYPPEVARRLSEKLEIHHTPVHGSWLNMAEIELSVLARQVVNQRMETPEQVQAEVLAWQERRNQQLRRIQWQFTNQDARIKLQRLYPSIEVG